MGQGAGAEIPQLFPCGLQNYSINIYVPNRDGENWRLSVAPVSVLGYECWWNRLPLELLTEIHNTTRLWWCPGTKNVEMEQI